MGWFDKFTKRNGEVTSVPEIMTKVTCTHLWTDFPWYIKASFDGKTENLHVEIIKPFVCVKCHERMDITLQAWDRHYDNAADAGKFVDSLKEKYSDRIQTLAEINNDIAMLQYVDKEALEMFNKIHVAETVTREKPVVPTINFKETLDPIMYDDQPKYSAR